MNSRRRVHLLYFFGHTATHLLLLTCEPRVDSRLVARLVSWPPTASVDLKRQPRARAREESSEAQIVGPR